MSSFLLTAERVAVTKLAPAQAKPTVEEINRKYQRGDIRIVTEQARYPLSTVPGLVDGDDYNLNPEFQRRHRWTADRQSKLIESLIMNVPIPPIFLYEDKFSHYEVMDGLQRLTAISEFYRDRFVLQDLEEWPELNGFTYTTLPEDVRRGVDRRYLSSIILLHETAQDPLEAQRLKQLVFERINSGGVKLESQESRNALYDGQFNRLCIKLARNRHLCKLWEIPHRDNSDDFTDAGLDNNNDYRKMFDVELVLRFFARRQPDDLQGGTLKSFLDLYLQAANAFPDSLRLDLSSLFEATIELVDDVLGQKAFWLWRWRYGDWSWLERPTGVIYAPLMTVFSRHLDNSERLRASGLEVREELRKLYEDHRDEFDGRYTNVNRIRARERLIDGALTRAMG